MTFQIGQKVVCVDDNFAASWYKIHTPRRGLIYTVRGICTFDFEDEPAANAIYLQEIKNPLSNWMYEDKILFGREIPFWIARFRPIVQPKTDISIFMKMLTGAPNKLEGVE